MQEHRQLPVCLRHSSSCTGWTYSSRSSSRVFREHTAKTSVRSVYLRHAPLAPLLLLLLLVRAAARQQQQLAAVTPTQQQRLPQQQQQQQAVIQMMTAAAGAATGRPSGE
jgi:hypothetical protein